MSVESVPPVNMSGADLTLDVILSAFKHALKGKFEPDKINKAIGELGTERSWFERKKSHLKSPEDLLKFEWSGLLFEAGLPMTEEEVETVVSAVVNSINPDSADTILSYQGSVTTEDVMEDSRSNLDLTENREEEEVVFAKGIPKLPDVPNFKLLPTPDENMNTGTLANED